MGDSNGQSIAAQSALAQDRDDGEESGESRSLWTRLFRSEEPETDPERNAMEAVSDAGTEAMLGNLRRMRSMKVSDVAVPRADIVALPQDAPLDEVVAAYRESTLTRLPVYAETLDDPVGFLNLKDLALSHGFDVTA